MTCNFGNCWSIVLTGDSGDFGNLKYVLVVRMDIHLSMLDISMVHTH